MIRESTFQLEAEVCAVLNSSTSVVVHVAWPSRPPQPPTPEASNP